MADFKPKYTRTTVGSIYKGQDGKPDYMKLRGDNKAALLAALQNADEKKGLSLNLESKKGMLESLNGAVASGKLKEEYAVKKREYINNIPDYVRFEVVLSVKNEE